MESVHRMEEGDSEVRKCERNSEYHQHVQGKRRTNLKIHGYQQSNGASARHGRGVDEELPLHPKRKVLEECLRLPAGVCKVEGAGKFLTSYDESMHVQTMRELFALDPGNISQDVSSIYVKSSGSMKCVKSPEMNLNLELVRTQNKSDFISKAETLPPPSITVLNQTNNTKEPSTLPTVPEGKETAGTEEFDQVFKDQTKLENSDSFFNSAPKYVSTPVRRTNYTNELDDTKTLLNNQLNKLRDAAKEVEQQELLYQFTMEAASSFGKSGKPGQVPSHVPSMETENDHQPHLTPTLQDPSSAPVSNHVKEDAPSCGSDINSQLRREAAQDAAAME